MTLTVRAHGVAFPFGAWLDADGAGAWVDADSAGACMALPFGAWFGVYV